MSVVVVQIAYLQPRGGRITGRIGGWYSTIHDSYKQPCIPNIFKICIYLKRKLIQKPSIPTIALIKDLYYPANNHAGLPLKV
jgi:hypothetical protein